ncbi:alpha/beta hydrolase [Undibacterium cyanobacteriorum]|uniref:Alpha/beta hydrolase n=1 Tax=Undibacterium cyanobacteriorum TaxID=3073561 RepID=A0ABY9RNZ7_9BURK|nr:alpha/beta hydrolase [Undibacterium sp. 20NA77.5]WMW82000.1 alpha/beta hydrolase [Undibacterium sp. 20NA77.5]
MKSSRSEFVALRGLNMHFRHWGNPDAPKLFMVHGWMDVAASFQFVVDCLARDWHVIAPDWRGFGLTEYPKVESYWFPDYVADLDAILEHFSPDAPVNLVGHSMGGNISMIYAGVRPERIAKLVNLEGFGMPMTQAKQAPGRYRKWLEELRQVPTLRPYASAAEVAARLQKTNPRLRDDRAAYLAQHWAKENAQGQWELLADPAHKNSSPLLYHVDEVLECWQSITAPVLWVEANDTDIWRMIGAKEEARAEIDRRMKFIPQLKAEVVMDAGHMLHHDQPEVLARLIEDFFIQE